MIDGGCPCMFGPTADLGHKAMRFVFTLSGNVPREVLSPRRGQERGRMAHIEGEILIGRSVEDVFDFVADERNEPRYNPRMLRAEKISPGPIGAGTRFRAEMSRETSASRDDDRAHRV